MNIVTIAPNLQVSLPTADPAAIQGMERLLDGLQGLFPGATPPTLPPAVTARFADLLDRLSSGEVAPALGGANPHIPRVSPDEPVSSETDACDDARLCLLAPLAAASISSLNRSPVGDVSYDVTQPAGPSALMSGKPMPAPPLSDPTTTLVGASQRLGTGEIKAEGSPDSRGIVNSADATLDVMGDSTVVSTADTAADTVANTAADTSVDGGVDPAVTFARASERDQTDAAVDPGSVPPTDSPPTDSIPRNETGPARDQITPVEIPSCAAVDSGRLEQRNPVTSNGAPREALPAESTGPMERPAQPAVTRAAWSSHGDANFEPRRAAPSSRPSQTAVTDEPDVEGIATELTAHRSSSVRAGGNFDAAAGSPTADLGPPVPDVSTGAMSLTPTSRPEGMEQVLLAFGQNGTSHRGNRTDLAAGRAVASLGDHLKSSRRPPTEWLSAPHVPAEVAVPAEAFGAHLQEVVLRQWEAAHEPESSRVVLRLDPPELGSIDVHVALANDHVSIRLVATEEGARHVLEQQLQTLHQALQDQGLTVQQCEVGFGSTGHGAQGSLSQSADDSGRGGDPRWSPESVPPTVELPRRLRSLLDYVA